MKVYDNLLVSNLAKPEIKGRAIMKQGNTMYEVQTYYTTPEADWIFDETRKDTYLNPVYLEQCKQKKITPDDTGWVPQIKQDGTIVLSQEEIEEEIVEETIDDIKEENKEDLEFDDFFDDDEIDDILDEVEIIDEQIVEENIDEELTEEIQEPQPIKLKLNLGNEGKLKLKL